MSSPDWLVTGVVEMGDEKKCHVRSGHHIDMEIHVYNPSTRETAAGGS